MKCYKIFRFSSELIIILIVLTTGGKAETSCNTNENCANNEFCDVNSSLCKLCLDCNQHNRDSKDIQCPKDILEDCGSCLQGYASTSHGECQKSEEIHPSSQSRDVTLVIDFPQITHTDVPVSDTSDKEIKKYTTEAAIPEETTSSYTKTTTKESHITEPKTTVPTTILYKVDYETSQSIPEMKLFISPLQTAESSIRIDDQDNRNKISFETSSKIPEIKLFNSPLQTELPTQTDDHVNSSGVLTTTSIDYGDKNAPWKYVALGFTFFVLFGTAGVVGFKYYLLPKQLKERQLKKQVLARENDRNFKKDLQNASNEERERLYYDELNSSNSNYIGLNYTKIYGKDMVAKN